MSAKSKFVAATGIVLALGFAAMMMPVLFLAVLGGGGGAAGCAPATQVTYTGPAVGDLTTIQMQRAASVVSQGRQMGIPDQGIIVALATASQESGFRVYANDGKGGDLRSDQKGIEASLNLPHDAVGTDHGSLGVFQQQWPWWGTMAELMDPATSARKFYEALLKVEGWQNLPVTVAAQRVQRSAYPDAYADDEPLARDLLAAIGGSPSSSSDSGDSETVNASTSSGDLEIELVNGVYVGGFTDCLMPAAAVGGAVVFPLPSGSGYVNQNNFGETGGRWSSFHTGNDYSVSCGTPVLAATGGTVEFDDSQAGWAGPNFVRISSGGPSTLATWYAHMQTRTVSDGQTVSPGQQIGTVGQLGNASGCHLHFEVHPKGGRIYDDPVDPVAWLAANLGKDLTTPVSSTSGGSRTVVSFNALGHSHTAPGGDSFIHRDSTARTKDVVKLLESKSADVVGLQEFQSPQMSVLKQATSETWGRFASADNAVIWRRSAFELVSTRTFAIPYFGGHDKHMPVVTLRDLASGKEITVISVHNPASGCAVCGGNNDKWRTQSEQIERTEISKEQAAGRPVLLLGDFNAKKAPFCALTAGGLMSAANGGSNTGTCTPPANAGIDWIFGAGAGFGDYDADWSTKTQKISDHPWVQARFALGATVAAPPGGTDTLTVLSYNIKHGTIAKNNGGGLAALASEITNSGAMVVALQEADNLGGGDFGAVVQDLARTLRMQFAYAVTGIWNGRQTIDNAILSKYPIVDADNTNLPGGPGIQPRGLLRVTVDLGESAGLVDVYGSHLHYTGDVRVTQAAKIRSEIGTPDCATVLMGDMNTTPGSKPHAELTATMRDAFADGRFGPGNTSPVGTPKNRIDYVFYDPDTSVVDAMVMPAGLSDHRAVRATLQLTSDGYC